MTGVEEYNVASSVGVTQGIGNRYGIQGDAGALTHGWPARLYW